MFILCVVNAQIFFFLFNLHSEESLFGFSIAIGFSKTRLLQSTVGDFHSCLDFHFNNSYHSVSCI